MKILKQTAVSQKEIWKKGEIYNSFILISFKNFFFF